MIKRLWRWLRDTNYEDEPRGSRTDDGTERDVAWARLIERRVGDG